VKDENNILKILKKMTNYGVKSMKVDKNFYSLCIKKYTNQKIFSIGENPEFFIRENKKHSIHIDLIPNFDPY